MTRNKKKQGGGERYLSLKPREGGSLFPSDPSVRKKALFRGYDFIICEALLGITSLSDTSLILHRCGTSVMKHIYHLQNDKNVQMKLSVLTEVIAKSRSLFCTGRLHLTYGAIDSLIILPLQAKINLILSVRSPLSILI